MKLLLFLGELVRAVVVVAAYLLAGAAIGILLFATPRLVVAARGRMQEDESGIVLASLLGATLLACLLGLTALAVHELGHLAAAWVVDFWWHRFRVGPLEVVRENRRHRVRLCPLQYPLGLVAAYPRDARRTRGRFAAYVLAGPLANLGCCGYCLAFAFVRSDLIPETTWRQLRVFAVCFAMLNASLVLTSLTPSWSPGFRSDGAHLLALVSGSRQLERELLVGSLWTAMQLGTRPAASNADQVARLLELRDGGLQDVSADLFGYYCALDSDQVERAGVLVDHAVLCLEEPHREVQAAVLLEAAYFEAIYRHNPVAARLHFERCRNHQAELPTRLRAEAAVLLAEGFPEQAAAKARNALEALAFPTDRGGAISEREWLWGLLEQCRT